MFFLTQDLVHRPSPDQTRWLANAMPLQAARWAWVNTLILGLVTFVYLRIVHVGPINSLMCAILTLAALATSLAPCICQSVCAHAVLKLRAGSTDTDRQDRRFKRVAFGYAVLLVGLWCVVGSYNLLSLSILMSWSDHPLELVFPQWPVLSFRLLFGGWAALALGEYWLLRSLKS